jgi:hypothetical protein
MPIESQNNSKEEGYDEFNAAEYNTASRQAFVNTEQVLFELASAERLRLIKWYYIQL